MILFLAAALAAQQVAAVDVADAVASEFAAHDWNGDGVLSRAEFGAWMARLRAPGAVRVAAETRTWVTAAFDAADANRDGVVSQTELTALLTEGRS